MFTYKKSTLVRRLFRTVSFTFAAHLIQLKQALVHSSTQFCLLSPRDSGVCCVKWMNNQISHTRTPSAETLFFFGENSTRARDPKCEWKWRKMIKEQLARCVWVLERRTTRRVEMPSNGRPLREPSETPKNLLHSMTTMNVFFFFLRFSARRFSLKTLLFFYISKDSRSEIKTSPSARDEPL